MAFSARTQTVGGVAVVLALIGAAAGMQRLREARYPPPPVTEASLYLTSGATARRLTAGYTELTADLYWIRTIQYYGDMKLRLARSAAARGRSGPSEASSEYALLYPLLDVTTTLDPRFNIAYRFGSIFLAEPYPGGAGRPDLAIALLEKGLRERPDKWEYMQDIGFVYYWWRQDYRAAAEWFKKASEVPGAPWFLGSLAATTLAEGGDRGSSRTMWESIRASAEIDWLRNEAERRLRQLDAADLVDAVQRRIDRMVPATGRIADWQGLVRAGVLPGLPVDPTGTPLVIDAEGRVHVSPKSPLFPLPDEPKHAAPPPS
jgi:tetratricopeptide (TPR) repeat protein